MVRQLIIIGLVLLAACAPRANTSDKDQTIAGRRIVSLDYCADQYVLKFANRNEIAGLSPDAEKIFSYMREEAAGLNKVRPRAEDVLLLNPDIVVRTYGGGPNAAAFFERAGIEVVQIGYAASLDDVKTVIQKAADDIGASEKGRAVVTKMETRLSNISKNPSGSNILYLTSKGAVAGTGTLIDELLTTAGMTNFQTRPGWNTLSLERLAHEQPDRIAASFFDTSDLVSDIWTPARHPIAQRQLARVPVTELPSAWTSCGAWFLVDVIEALAADQAALEQTIQ
ncbi:MAG: iron ABC transporter substrate-binding protein [Hyphococcus sp.]|nr:MAG: iron ABC transporter substrate-binding protein [Marinicaulis sp.]